MRWTIVFHVVTLVMIVAGSPFAASAADRPEPVGYRVYVTNEGSGDISIIDPDSRAETKRIPLGKRPRGLAASPDNRLLYIALSGSPVGGPGVDVSALPPADKTADGIAVFDTVLGKVLRVIGGISDPEQLAVSPDGRRLYVASEDTGQLIILDSARGTVWHKLSVGGEPEGVAVSPDGAIVVVTSEEDNSVSIIDARQPTVLVSVSVGARPRNVAFSNSGLRAFVTGENDATLSVIDVPGRRVTNTIKLGDKSERPMDVKLPPLGDRLYVTTGRGGRLVAIDAVNFKVTHRVAVGERPWGLAISPDGRFLFTANGPSNDVTMVDAMSMEVLARIKVGERPWGVAVVSDP